MSLKVSIVVSLVAHVSMIDTKGAGGFTRYTLTAQHSDYTLCGASVSIALNAATSTYIQDDCFQPLVFLADGELFAKIRASASRPFRVVHNHLVLVVLGTSFDVSAHENLSDVSVTSGVVRVYEQCDDGHLEDPIVITSNGVRRAPVILRRGDLARVEERDGAVLVTRDPNDPRAAENRISWLQEEYIIDNQRLDSVVWEFNRYSHDQIVLGDREIEQMKLGGRYHLSRMDDFVSQLRGFGVEVARVDTDKDHAVRYIVRLPANAKTAPSRKRHRR